MTTWGQQRLNADISNSYKKLYDIIRNHSLYSKGLSTQEVTSTNMATIDHQKWHSVTLSDRERNFCWWVQKIGRCQVKLFSTLRCEITNKNEGQAIKAWIVYQWSPVNWKAANRQIASSVSTHVHQVRQQKILGNSFLMLYAGWCWEINKQFSFIYLFSKGFAVDKKKISWHERLIMRLDYTGTAGDPTAK